jgi:uncharacterized protein (TIGR02246 family)
MPTALPAPLDDYVTATNARDHDRFVALFASDAVVQDEGREHRGRAAIRAWREQTAEVYTFTLAPRDVASDGDGRTVLTATAAGDFPGSPVDLRFAFVLRDGAIAALEIRP